MNIDTLPDEADFVFFVEALPEDGLHRLAIAVEGMDAPIPTSMIAVDIDIYQSNPLLLCYNICDQTLENTYK